MQVCIHYRHSRPCIQYLRRFGTWDNSRENYEKKSRRGPQELAQYRPETGNAIHGRTKKKGGKEFATSRARFNQSLCCAIAKF